MSSHDEGSARGRDPEPLRVDEEWLAGCLEERGYAADFDRVETELIGRFSTDVWRLRVRAKGRSRPPDLILKRCVRPSRTGEPPELEALVCQRLADAIPARMPRFIGWRDKDLLITDVPDLEHFDFRTAPSPAHSEAAVDALAAIHAHYWERTQGLDFVPQIGDLALREAWQADFDAGWRLNRSRFDEWCPAFMSIGDALVGRLTEVLEGLVRPRTLLHGDPHAENLPLGPSGEAVVLDWQSPRVGNAGFDLAVFLAMSFDGAARRRVEETLIGRHAKAIQANGHRWDDPWTDYRLGLLRRAARIVEISAQGDFASLPWVFQRCATAAVELHVEEFIQ